MESGGEGGLKGVNVEEVWGVEKEGLLKEKMS